MSYRRTDNIVPVLAIIILCFLVFIATSAADFMGHNLIPLLGLQPISFLQQPWTMITDLFVHGGFVHILFNMITLYFFGTFLIRLVGTRDFLIIYFLGGIVGNLLFMLFAFFNFLTSPYSIVIGASGAIFALGGALAVLTPRLRVFVIPIPVPMPLWVAVIGFFILLTAIGIATGDIAWQGHLGGLVTGLAAGWLLRKSIRTPYS